MAGISIIVPCKNEEKYISLCINSLLRQEDVNFEKEIIVVDNGSTDNTLNILKKYGSSIRLYSQPGQSIAGLRNFGVGESTKEWIAFIDADVEVSDDWAKKILAFLEDQSRRGTDTKKIITGSTCLVPENPTWVEHVWFEQIMLRDANAAKYINSGNMIINKEFFESLGGFDITYKTGEEEKLCDHARKNHGGIIVKNPFIKAVHHGYPKNVINFFQRMRWHGKGMSRYLLTPWKSKPLMLAIYYILLSALFLIAAIKNGNVVLSLLIYLFLMFVPALLLAVNRGQNNVRQVILLTYLYVCFGWARAFSIYDFIFNKDIYHRK